MSRLAEDLGNIVRVHGLTFEEWAEDAGVQPDVLQDTAKQRRLISMWLRDEDPSEFSFEEEEVLVVPAWIRRR
jgi:hypothetical protein